MLLHHSLLHCLTLELLRMMSSYHVWVHLDLLVLLVYLII